MRRLLSIGTTDALNAAGMGVDARVAFAYGMAHACCVVAVSAQDRHGLHALAAIEPAVVEAQLATVTRADAIRVGALVSSHTVRIVARFVRTHAPGIPTVVDPVLGVSLGGDLAVDEALEHTLMQELLVLPVIVTPNLPEAAQLLQSANDGDPIEAAQRFVARGAFAAVVKGGHGSGDPIDVFADRRGVRTFSAPRIPGRMRGTGCTLAAALACELARGRTLDAALSAAREYVRERIAAGVERDGMQVAF